MGYRLRETNPILACVADQTRYDKNWPEDDLDGVDLLEEIIEAIEEKVIDWPEDFKLMSCQEWIKKMKIDPTFYTLEAKSAPEFLAYEHHLLNMASQFLKRKIVLVPYFEKDQEQSFKLQRQSLISKMFRSSKTYYLIFCCSEGFTHNFYMSIFVKC